ncbi:MAG: L,D-transpeptidase, partial [Planctomycetota bacterium]
WRFIQRVNKINDPRRIRIGQTLKLVRGPFHAEISKRDYRLDLWAELPTDAGGGRIFIASFPVGLGENNSTPAGSWRVRTNSRLINPPWTNPRTGEYFSADNPENPIGERWIGLEGTDENTSVISGIGIHGTIEPGSIGTQASMGCVRMHDQDVRVLYELLAESSSTVMITP